MSHFEASFIDPRRDRDAPGAAAVSGVGGPRPFDALKAATQAAHDRLHRALAVDHGGVSDPGAVQRSYLALLDAIAQLEVHELRAASLTPLTGREWREARRCAAARADAFAIRATLRHHDSPEPARAVREKHNGHIVSCGATALGFQYVLEGSALGAPVIARRVIARCGPDTPMSYLSSFESPVGRWNRFRNHAEPHLSDAASSSKAIVAAIETFRFVERSLGGSFAQEAWR